MRRFLAGFLLVPFAVGCGLVFGISSGEYDPDPFGDGGRPDVVTDSNPPADAPPENCVPGLIDDLEDDNLAIPRCEGRQGVWVGFSVDIPGGAQKFVVEAPGSPVSSKFAAHTSGHGLDGKVGMRFTLNQPPGADRGTYDMSKYKGIKFRAKAGAAVRVYMNLRDKNRDPDGKVCDSKGTCNDLFGEGCDLTTEWKECSIPFSELEPDRDAGSTETVDLAHVYGIDFHVLPKKADFDFWIDDVAFLP
ncbi:hypothetical protein LZC95_42845 [Pendulispora brunnea]|uniref:CBM11 domain-containing protein n=1 Tax=Pendulispora brunnea TaxID=2905690 RepID=A0ABZ2K388_9BACT